MNETYEDNIYVEKGNPGNGGGNSGNGHCWWCEEPSPHNPHNPPAAAPIDQIIPYLFATAVVLIITLGIINYIKNKYRIL